VSCCCWRTEEACASDGKKSERRGEWSSDAAMNSETVMNREELRWKKRERWRTEKDLDERATRELQNLREMQKLRATENKRGKNKIYRARSSFFPVPICNRPYLALFFFVVINWGTNYLKRRVIQNLYTRLKWAKRFYRSLEGEGVSDITWNKNA
jgi:hypothetical protein